MDIIIMQSVYLPLLWKYTKISNILYYIFTLWSYWPRLAIGSQPLTQKPWIFIYLKGFMDIITMHLVFQIYMYRSKEDSFWKFTPYCTFGPAQESPEVVRLQISQFRFLLSYISFQKYESNWLCSFQEVKLSTEDGRRTTRDENWWQHVTFKVMLTVTLNAYHF